MSRRSSTPLTRTDFRNLLTQYPEISLGLARILAERLEEANKQVGVEFVSLTKNINFDPKVVGLVPQNILLQHKVVPIAYGNNALTLAMVNPSNLVAFDDVRRYVKGVIIEPRGCTEDEFSKFMSSEYPKLMNIEEEVDQDKEQERLKRVTLPRFDVHHIPKQSSGSPRHRQVSCSRSTNACAVDYRSPRSS